MRLMAICHGAFCFGHAAHTVWTWGVLKSSWGVLVLVMGRFTAVLGGAASSLPAIRRHTGNEDVVPPVRLNSAQSSLQMVWLNFARSSQSRFQETIVSRVPHVPLRHRQSAKHKASHCTATCKSRSSKHKGLKVSRDAKFLG